MAWGKVKLACINYEVSVHHLQVGSLQHQVAFFSYVSILYDRVVLNFINHKELERFDTIAKQPLFIVAIFCLQPRENYIRSVRLANEGTSLVVGGEASFLCVWDLAAVSGTV